MLYVSSCCRLRPRVSRPGAPPPSGTRPPRRAYHPATGHRPEMTMNANEETPSRFARPRGRAEGQASTALAVTREVCRDYTRSSRIEWLETNGTGGFAMGTAAGANTRRYHGLLVAPLRPPVDRFVLLSKVEETVQLDGESRDLSTTQYPGVVHPQ